MTFEIPSNINTDNFYALRSLSQKVDIVASAPIEKKGTTYISKTPNYASQPYYGDNIVITTSGQSIEMPIDFFHEQYYRASLPKISPVVKKVINNLFHERDYLALQLDYEFGNLTEEEFTKEEANYLTETVSEDENLLFDQMNLLFDISESVFDAEQISVAFNCSIDVAQKLITRFVKVLEIGNHS